MNMKKFEAANGTITFDFGKDSIRIEYGVFNMAGMKDIAFKISDVTAIETRAPRFMKGGSLVFIINGIRYKNRLDSPISATQLVFDKKVFAEVEKVLATIVEQNGLVGFHDIDSVDAKVELYTGEVPPRG